MNIEMTEDRLVQKTVADYMEQQLGWESVFAYNTEILGAEGTLGRSSGGKLKVSGTSPR